jgi:hypothetical protein
VLTLGIRFGVVDDCVEKANTNKIQHGSLYKSKISIIYLDRLSPRSTTPKEKEVE